MKYVVSLIGGRQSKADVVPCPTANMTKKFIHRRGGRRGERAKNVQIGCGYRVLAYHYLGRGKLGERVIRIIISLQVVGRRYRPCNIKSAAQLRPHFLLETRVPIGDQHVRKSLITDEPVGE